MAPEQIRPGQSNAKGFINARRPGRSEFDQLSQALEGGLDLAVKGLGIHRAAEARRFEDELSNEFLTVEEVDELIDIAKHPANVLKLKNRRGMILAEEARAGLEERVAEAREPLEAHRIIRETQDEMLQAFGEDDAVQAGIQEAFGSFAPGMLNQASRRRKEDRERENAASIGGMFDAKLKGGNIGELVDEAIEIAKEEPDINLVYSVLQNSLDSFVAQGFDPEKPGVNPHREIVVDVIERLDEERGYFAENPEARADFLKLQGKLIVDDQRDGARRAESDATSDPADLAIVQATQLMVRGEEVPKSLLMVMPRVDAAFFIKHNEKQAQGHHIHPAVKRNRKLVAKVDPVTGFAGSPEELELLKDYDLLVQSLPKDISDEEITEITDNFVRNKSQFLAEKEKVREDNLAEIEKAAGVVANEAAIQAQISRATKAFSTSRADEINAAAARGDTDFLKAHAEALKLMSEKIRMRMTPQQEAVFRKTRKEIIMDAAARLGLFDFVDTEGILED